MPSKGVTTLLPTFMSRIFTKPFGVSILLSSDCSLPAARIPPPHTTSTVDAAKDSWNPSCGLTIFPCMLDRSIFTQQN